LVAKAQAVLSEAELLRAMFDIGYFPPNTPPDFDKPTRQLCQRTRRLTNAAAEKDQQSSRQCGEW
jgi:hypothetical protein